jgi:hypothetical protein
VAATALALLSVLLSAAFVGVSLAYNQGRLIAPLDDVYIHLQYAKQIGQGHFFQYNAGDPITTGASSFLYPLILGAAWALGCQGTGLLVFAVVFGIACLATTTVLVYLLGRRLASPVAGVWASVLVACSGPLLWGATSGMEVGLTAALLTGSVYAFVREQPDVRFVATPLIGVPTALVRPEGLLFECFVCVAMVVSLLLGARARRIRRVAAIRGTLLSLTPLMAGAGQLLFYKVATGSTVANGVHAKSLLYEDIFWPTDVLYSVASNLRGLFGLLTGVTNQDFTLPGGIVLAGLGVFALAYVQPRRRLLALVCGLGMLCAFVAICTLVTALWQNVRYAQPFLPVFLLLVVLGAHVLAEVGAQPAHRPVVLHGVLTLALLFSLAALPTWAARLGQQAATIRSAPISIAHWLNDNIPPGASVGANDIGAIAYFGTHRIVDVIGLTTNGMAAATSSGSGSMYEALRHMPVGQRPDYFSLYDSWIGPQVHDLANVGVLGAPLTTFRLTTPPRPSAGTPTVCQADQSCPQVSIYRADWSLAGTGDQMRTALPGTLRDYLNVGDIADEARHDYRPELAHTGLQPKSMLRGVTYPGGPTITDSGRHIVGGESFTAANLVPGRPLTIGVRIQPTHGQPVRTRQLQILVSGRSAGVWTLALDPLGWSESAYPVPAELITGGDARIELRPLEPLLEPLPDYTSFGYWFSQ